MPAHVGRQVPAGIANGSSHVAGCFVPLDHLRISHEPLQRRVFTRCGGLWGSPARGREPVPETAAKMALMGVA
jgi:hypothetical protein